MRATLVALALWIPPLGAAAQAVSIRFQPTDAIAYREAPGRDYFSVMVHNIAVINDGPGAVALSGMRIEALEGERVASAVVLGTGDLRESAARMNGYQAAGVLEQYDFYFQTSRLLPEGTPLAATNALSPGEALIVSQIPLLVRHAPDRVRVTALWPETDGTGSGTADLPVVEFHTANDYVFPVVGIWYNAAGAGLRTHHRWVSNEEFALDLAVLGPNGRSRRGEADSEEDFWAYGRDVLAIADGTVVAVESEMPETREMFPRDGESAEAFEARVAQMQAGFLAQSIYAAGGNFVSIEHANGEYSHYLHLAEGSVSLSVGDRVSQGQVIGRVGHSGNSTEPHLHFQLTDGPDPLYSRGLPIVFTNAVEMFDRLADQSPGSGWVIEATEPGRPD